MIVQGRLRSDSDSARKNGTTIETEYTLPLPPEKTGIGVKGVQPTVSFGGAGVPICRENPLPSRWNRDALSFVRKIELFQHVLPVLPGFHLLFSSGSIAPGRSFFDVNQIPWAVCTSGFAHAGVVLIHTIINASVEPM